MYEFGEFIDGAAMMAVLGSPRHPGCGTRRWAAPGVCNPDNQEEEEDTTRLIRM